MARDYKRRSAPPSRTTRARASVRAASRFGWWSMLAGLGIGLAVALGVHLYDTAIAPGSARAPRADATRVAANPHRSRARPQAQHPRRASQPTRFEFYSLLPEMEVVVPDEEVVSRGAPAPDGHASPPAAGSARYVLQAGAFRSLKDADRLRATLALAGMEATIQTVATGNDETWHRVRLGPYVDLNALAQARGRLRAAHIEPIVLKIKT